jgi:hypothetical protein
VPEKIFSTVVAKAENTGSVRGNNPKLVIDLKKSIFATKKEFMGIQKFNALVMRRVHPCLILKR